MSDAAADAAPITEQEILSTYRQMQSEMQGLVQNLTKIDMERNEHRYVVRVGCIFYSRNTVSFLRGKRRCRFPI
jgi:hypothetical protein